MSNPLVLGKTLSDYALALPAQALLRHCVVLGASGSGKTVLSKLVLEEAVRSGIPSIVIDPQGDMASMAMPYNDPATMVKKGTPVKLAQDFLGKADVKIWTPSSSSGIAVSLAPRLNGASDLRYEDQIRSWTSMAISVASMGGFKATDEVIATITTALEYADSYSLVLDTVHDLIAFLDDPPALLRDELDKVLDAKGRDAMVKKLRAKMAGSARLNFELGRPLDVEDLFGYEKGGARDQGKARVSVIYLNTLSGQQEKETFVAALCNAVYDWMLRNPSPVPQGILCLDEAKDFLPPVRRPASKAGLELLLRQGRKYGICCLLATQSPGDLDYAALGQVGTWMLGRLPMAQQAEKVRPILNAMKGVDGDALIDSLPQLEKGRFIMASPDHFATPVPFDIRYLSTQHRTLTQDDVEGLVSDADRAAYGHQ